MPVPEVLKTRKMSQSPHTLLLATSLGEVTDPKTWSATPKRIHDHLGAPCFDPAGH